MATAPPKVIEDRVEGTEVYVGTNIWFFHWLANTDLQSFRYECSEGSFTARQRKGGYWNAYRKLDGKLRQEYLGKAEDLTLTKLIETARVLALPGMEYWRKKYPRPGEPKERLDNEVIQAKDTPPSADQLQDRIAQLEKELAEVTQERDNYRDTLDEFIKDGERWHKERKQLEAKVFSERHAARILEALGVGRQALQYKRVQSAIKELMR